MNSSKRDFLGLLGVVAIFCIALCVLPMNGFLGVAILMITVAVGLAVMMRKKKTTVGKKRQKNSKRVKVDSEYDGWLNEENAMKILKEIDSSLESSDLVDAMTEDAKERRLAGKAKSEDYIHAIDKIAGEYNGLRVRITRDGFEIEGSSENE
jgi:hypothetical protein